MNESTGYDCLARIRDVFPKLNAAEKKAAAYILENTEDIVHFTITDLADKCGVSQATVFRLCQKLGYKGYQDLKINLAYLVVKPVQNIHEEINEDDDMYIIKQKILNSNLYSLEETMKLNDDKVLEKAVDFMLQANQILFFGMGGSGVLAYDAYHKFIRTGIRCAASSDGHWQAMYASLAQQGDVIVAFSNSGSNKDLVESIKIGKENGLNIISVTGNSKSPLAEISDVVLISYGKESAFRSEAMESRISALALVDCLYVGVALKRKEDTLKNLYSIRKGIAVKRY